MTTCPSNEDVGGVVEDDVILQHLDVAYRLARWRVQHDRVAEEVVAESVRRAVLAAAAARRASLLRIVSVVCNERRHRTTPRLESGAGHADEIAAGLANAISRLPDHLREALVLRDLEGLSYDELAEVIGVSCEAAKARLSRARQALTGMLATSAAGV
ncbi:MAG TPA: sigma-70 family RNA polymerase sigma factor [Vicinamibacterales bacterium]|nr:sigma-70 family RNA polymerase sigma factor [Vicinamibacterales bacterium]